MVEVEVEMEMTAAAAGKRVSTPARHADGRQRWGVMLDVEKGLGFT